MLNTENFEQALYTDAKRAFDKIIEEKGEDLYVIGFYHFGGWDGVMALFNTRSDLAPLQKISYGEDQKGYELGVKWCPSDFPSLEEYSEYFERSTEEIHKLRDQIDELSEDFQADWQQTLKALQRVLNRLDAEGVFSQTVNRDTLTLYIANYDEDYQCRYERVKALNPESVLERVSPEFEYMIALYEKWEQAAFAEMMQELEAERDEPLD